MRPAVLRSRFLAFVAHQPIVNNVRDHFDNEDCEHRLADEENESGDAEAHDEQKCQPEGQGIVL